LILSEEVLKSKQIAFGMSAVARPRNLPKSKSPFMPDLKLSIYDLESYFQSFFLLLDVLKLTFKKNNSNYLFKNFSTIFAIKLPVNEQVIHLFLGNYPPKNWIEGLIPCRHKFPASFLSESRFRPIEPSRTNRFNYLNPNSTLKN